MLFSSKRSFRKKGGEGGRGVIIKFFTSPHTGGGRIEGLLLSPLPSPVSQERGEREKGGGEVRDSASFSMLLTRTKEGGGEGKRGGGKGGKGGGPHLSLSFCFADAQKRGKNNKKEEEREEGSKGVATCVFLDPGERRKKKERGGKLKDRADTKKRKKKERGKPCCREEEKRGGGGGGKWRKEGSLPSMMLSIGLPREKGIGREGGVLQAFFPAYGRGG